MNRFHIQLSVQDLQASMRFYSALFGAPPSRASDAHAAWWLDDPRLSFAISAGTGTPGRGHLDHLGIVADSPLAHHAATQGLQLARRSLPGQTAPSCCGERGDATSVRDPQNILWRSVLAYGASSTLLDVGGATSRPGDACCPAP